MRECEEPVLLAESAFSVDASDVMKGVQEHGCDNRQ
jgi:hypothetical protein